MKELRFNVFRTLVSLIGADGRWQAFYPGRQHRASHSGVVRAYRKSTLSIMSSKIRTSFATQGLI